MPDHPSIEDLRFPKQSVAFDLEAFDNAVLSHGLRFIHYRAMVNPVGLIDKNDIQRPNGSSPSASNGMVYSLAGKVSALLIGNTKEVKSSNDMGVVDSSMAQFTPARHYTDCDKRVFLSPYDRLFLEEESVLVSRHELVEHSITNIDRPKFPPFEVLDCLDSNNISYSQGADFDVIDGKILWKDRKPGIDPSTGKGIVYAIRYVYRPFWYVQRLIHEIRVVQQEDEFSGERSTSQGSQSAIVQREYVFENEFSSNSDRRPDLPQDGSLGVR